MKLHLKDYAVQVYLLSITHCTTNFVAQTDPRNPSNGELQIFKTAGCDTGLSFKDLICT